MAKIAIDLGKGAIKDEKEVIIGIDLGTTNSLVGYMDEKIPKIILDKNGKNALVPSIIHFQKDTNAIVIGEQAKEKLITEPENTIYSIKRLMGKSFNDVEQVKGYLGYEIIDEDEDALVKVHVDGKFYSPIELSSKILLGLKLRAESILNKAISKAVITVPAYFNDTQRQATRDAGKLAGLDVLRIINEPTAASLAYGLDKISDKKDVIAVYDLGGGTFDISILEIQDGIFEVLSTNGDTYLGGDDFDKAIVDFWLQKNDLDIDFLQKNKNLAQALRLEAEKAKKTLSSESEYKGIYPEINTSITKSEFETLITPLVIKTLSACQLAINDANLKPSDINHVVMVGGSTRVPLVKEKVSTFFNQKVNDTLDPDQVVALGATIQADILAGNQKDMLLLDITPLSLGIETVGGLMDIILPRNSKIPARVGRKYTTSVDGQTKLKVSVFQGERDLVKDNRKLGEFILSGIPPMAAGIPKLEIQFIVNADGILVVRAIEERSNVQQSIEIRSQYGISEEDMALMLIDSIKNAETDMKVRGLLEARNEGNNVVLASKKFIEQNKEILTSDEIMMITNLVNELEATIQGNSKDDINLTMKKLNFHTEPIAHRVLDINIQNAMKGKKV